MSSVIEWIKEKKKIIIIFALVVLLIIIVCTIFGGSDSKTTYSDVSKTQTEIKLETLLESMDGIGDVEVMVSECDGEIIGVVIVCEGADKILIKNDILNAVSTALNINKNIIAVYSM